MSSICSLYDILALYLPSAPDSFISPTSPGRAQTSPTLESRPRPSSRATQEHIMANTSDTTGDSPRPHDPFRFSASNRDPGVYERILKLTNVNLRTTIHDVRTVYAKYTVLDISHCLWKKTGLPTVLYVMFATRSDCFRARGQDITGTALGWTVASETIRGGRMFKGMSKAFVGILESARECLLTLDE